MKNLTTKVVVERIDTSSGETVQVVFDGAFSLTDSLNIADIANNAAIAVGYSSDYVVYVVDIATGERVKVARA